MVRQSAEAGMLVSDLPVIAEELLSEKRDTARVAIASTRQLLLLGAMLDNPRQILDIDAVLNRKLGAGPDVAEGVQAFLEKRAPQFPLRPSADIPAEWQEWLAKQ